MELCLSVVTERRRTRVEIKLNTSVQDAFLQEVKEQHAPVAIFTTNGYQIRGIIIDYDDLSIQVDSDDGKRLVYKHALSTVAPISQRPGTQDTIHGSRDWRR